MPTNKYKLIAKTLHNLEDVLASELRKLGAEDVEIGRRAVSFTGDKEMLYKANLWLRTALRILKPVHTFRAKNADELYEELLGFDWSSIMRVSQSFAIDTTVFSDSFTHSKYVGYRAKDAIVDYWKKQANARPNVSLDAPDIYINIHIAQNEVTLSLDSSGESLHKRGYRDTQTDAPINEVLAAGILLKAGWDGSTDLIDPMCGSGTFLIEAALIARNIAPGIYRKNFAFEQWLDYDAELFERLYNDDSAELVFEHKIYGGDILPHAIRVSDSNIRRAGVSRDIQLDIMPFEERPQPTGPALIVMNPPYGERLKLSSPEALYAMIGERLKHNFSGCKAWLIAYKSEHFDSLGLKYSSRTEVMNGSLPCELRGYELFAGKRVEFKRQGADSSFDRRAERKARFAKDQKDTRPSATNPRQDRDKQAAKQFASKERRSRRHEEQASYDKGRGAFVRGEQSAKPREHRPKEKPFSIRKQEARPKRDGKPSNKPLWPSDRFNYTDAEGRVQQRKRPIKSIQVFRTDDK